MKVLCIGHATYDLTIIVDKYPEENVKIRVNNAVECGGGPASNAAYLLGKWGIETYFAGIVGNDEYGKRIKKEFDSVNVNTKYLQIGGKTTSSYIIVNKQNGSRTALTYHPDDLKMTNIDIDINPDIILMDGQEYDLSIKLLNKYPNAISVIDAGRNTKEVIELCKKVDYVVCSQKFLENFSNISITDNNTLRIAYDIANNQFKNLIVTLEAKGCAYKDKNLKIIPSIKVNTIDSTGAGDIFHGAFVYGLTQKWDMDKILYFANVTGALSVTRLGGRNSVFNKEEIMKVANEIKRSNIYR